MSGVIDNQQIPIACCAHATCHCDQLLYEPERPRLALSPSSTHQRVAVATDSSSAGTPPASGAHPVKRNNDGEDEDHE
jgi:hypothetical protein